MHGRIAELIIARSCAALDVQRNDGSLSAGHNGPYKDPETPVRNTAHWCISLLTAWELTGEERFRLGAERAVDYLLSREARPEGGAFFCRANPRKDKTNGLMGQAWAIEALVEAGARLERPDCIGVAADVFRLHSFGTREGGWRCVELDGTPTVFDRTFNHQLWFCAAGALLCSVGEVEFQVPVSAFLKKLPCHMKLYSSGLIRHVSAQFLNVSSQERFVGGLRWARNWLNRKALHRKAIGYHAFNTYALALIERSLPELRVGEMEPVQAVLRYLLSKEYAASISASAYGFPYNPPGLEAAVTIQTFFPSRTGMVADWLARQWAETYDPVSHSLSRQSVDPLTSAARIYEATRLYSRPIPKAAI